MRVAAPFAGHAAAALGATRRRGRRRRAGVRAGAGERGRRAPAGRASSCSSARGAAREPEDRQAPARGRRRSPNSCGRRWRRASSPRRTSGGSSSSTRAASSAPPRSTTHARSSQRDEAQVGEPAGVGRDGEAAGARRRDPRRRGRRASRARGAGAGRLAARAARDSRARGGLRPRHLLRRRRLGAGGKPRRERAAAGQREGALLRPRDDARRLQRRADGDVSPATAARRRSRRTITFIADRAEYTPPVLYSREKRAKLVYLVEARPAPADAAKLHPGQPVDVTLAPPRR